MIAAVLERPGAIESSPLVLREINAPAPRRGEIRVRVRCCAICRTDLHVIENDLPQRKLPLVPGHQIVGVVDQLGEGCSRLALGQRVGIAWLRYTCGTCEYCGADRENLCESSRYTGYDEDGGYAEYATVNEDFAYELPDALDDVDAAPLLCAGIIGYRALSRCGLPERGKLALFGFGSSAHIVQQLALQRGAEVFVVSRGESHRELSRALGASWAGERADDLPAKVDSAIVFAPAGRLVPTALRALKKGGVLALAGIHMTPIPEMDYEDCLFYERDIRSVTANTRGDGRALLAEAATVPIRPRTTTYPLRDANRALQDLKAGRIDGAGVLVMC